MENHRIGQDCAQLVCAGYMTTNGNRDGACNSTIMKMITGFLEPTSGTVTVCDYGILGKPYFDKLPQKGPHSLVARSVARYKFSANTPPNQYSSSICVLPKISQG
jgi:ABC-type cobalamin/Fe3+-siderophores transport system ATPase subunit